MQWLRERVHPTWLFTALCYGCVLGIALAQVWSAAIIPLVCGGLLLVICGFVFRRRMMIAVVLIGGLLLGLARGSWGQQDQMIYASLYKKHVVISGIVADDVDATNYGPIRVHLRSVMMNGKSLPGVVFGTVTTKSDVKRSDKLAIDGALDTGFGNFAASIKGNVTDVTREAGGDVPRDVRDNFADMIRRGVQEPEASLGIGYLLGQKNALPDDLVKALQATALTHIVVASGYNLTILVRLGRRLFAKTSKYLATLTSVALIIGFIAMTGLSPSMTRAGLISLLSLWAWYVGRKFHPVTLLGFAASLTALVNPSYVWGDFGWLLSFGAFAGVMIAAPIISNYFFGERVPTVGQILVETISAQLVTLPIMILAFQQLSVIGLFANVLILPFIPLAMLLVAIAGVGGWLLPSLATIISWPAQMLLMIQTSIISWCADITWALAKPQWQWRHLVIYFAVLIVALWYMKLRSHTKLYEASVIE